MYRRVAVIGMAFAILIAGLVVGQSKLQAAIANRAVDAPSFEVDPLWPKPLPNHWILGMTIGLGIDSKDHVFIVHRGPVDMHRAELGADSNPDARGYKGPVSDCCRAAPPVLEYAPDGSLVKA